MEILQLDKTQSYPPTTGAEIRSWRTAEKLGELGDLWRAAPWDGYTQLPDDIYLINFTSPVVTAKLIRNHAWYAGFTVGVRHPVQRCITNYVVEQVSNADPDFDVVVCEAPELTTAARRLAGQYDARLILNKHNCYFDFLDQFLRDYRVPTPVRTRAVRNLRRHEQRAIDGADVVVFQSDADCGRFDVPPSVTTTVIPNGTDYEDLQRDGDPERLARELGISADQHVCLFVGSFDYDPNHTAATFIDEELAPAFPEMAFLLVGRDPPTPTASNVYAPGYVADLVDALALADIALCPLARGSGTKLKMLDYLAADLPIVTTSVGTQGLPLADGEHVLVRDDPDAMRMAIDDLAGDEERRIRLGERGGSLGARFAWSRLLEGYEEILP